MQEIVNQLQLNEKSLKIAAEEDKQQVTRLHFENQRLLTDLHRLQSDLAHMERRTRDAEETAQRALEHQQMSDINLQRIQQLEQEKLEAKNLADAAYQSKSEAEETARKAKESFEFEEKVNCTVKRYEKAVKLALVKMLGQINREYMVKVHNEQLAIILGNIDDSEVRRVVKVCVYFCSQFSFSLVFVAWKDDSSLS